MRRRMSVLATIFVVLALVLAACGGDESAETTEGDTSGTTAGDSTATTAEGSTETTAGGGSSGEEVTLRVLIHQNPAFTDYMDTFNADFEAANPGVTVDMTVVAPADMPTSIQTRLSAADVDVIDYCVAPCAGFTNGIQPYMSGIEAPPTWQQLIEAGLIMDITDEPFVQNFDEATIQDATTFNDSVYAINMGRSAFSGMFTNTDLLAEVGVEIPTTWSELVAACQTITDAGYACMTQGGGDVWPIFVGSYGIIGAEFPDQAALSEGLWSGEIKWNEGKALELMEKLQVYAQDMLEQGVTGLSHDEATARYAAGDVAFLPTGTWQGANLEGFEPDFSWTYVPVPGTDDPADNQYLFGKYDLSFMIAEDTPNPDVAKAYLAALADPDNYQAFVDATGFLPTQPTATLNSTVGDAVAPLLGNYRTAFEQIWVAPTGAGQWANAWQGAAWFTPFNEWDDAKALADQAQADLEAGLNAG
jgi:raffinose/stachyose/melibiose transport system substrate-binding protein